MQNNSAARRSFSPGCLFVRRARAALGLAMLMPMSGCNWVFYYPDARIRGTPAEQGLRYEDVFFASNDGVKLHGWFLPAAGAARGTVLHVHGNAANVSGHYEFVSWLPAAGYSVLSFDYRGYGRSEGRVTREGTVQDALAALDYLRSRPDVDNSRIVLFGQSLGGTVATVVAAERHGQVRALAIDSTFSRYRDIVRHHVFSSPALTVLAWWLPFTIPHGQDCVDVIARVAPMPVLIVQGKDDTVVPWRMACELYEAAGEPKELWLVDGVDHMAVWFERPEEAKAKLLDFYANAIEK